MLDLYGGHKILTLPELTKLDACWVTVSSEVETFHTEGMLLKQEVKGLKQFQEVPETEQSH